jgi:hypothetical protein
MNLEEALAKDGEAKAKLLAAIKENHQLDAKAFARTDVCMLGNWLHGEGERKYQFLKSYKPCVEAHAAFHAEVEKVVRQVNLREQEQVQAMLANGAPCTKAFISLVIAVRNLKAEAKL